MKFFSGISISLTAVLVGCASAPPTREVVVPLLENVAVMTGDVVLPPDFVELTAAVTHVPVGKIPPAPGVIWLRAKSTEAKGTEQPPFVLLTDVVELTPLRGSPKSYRLTLKSKEIRTLAATWFWFELCEPGVNPSNGSCYRAHSFRVRKMDLRGLKPTAEVRVTDLRAANLVNISRVYAPSEVAKELAMLDNQYLARKRQEAAVDAAYRARAEIVEKERKAYIKNAPKGTVQNCTSYSLVEQGQPISASLSFNCGGIGQTSMAELRAAGWDARVTGRIPTQAMVGVADSIELEAVKRR